MSTADISEEFDPFVVEERPDLCVVFLVDAGVVQTVQTELFEILQIEVPG